MMEDTLYNNIDEILAENRRRHAVLYADDYDQMTGRGCCGDRVEAAGCLVPREVVTACPAYATLEPLQQERLRIREDFEYWCARCATIRDKLSGRIVPLLLNRPQRRLVAVMEGQRRSGQPVRVILLKARQWGGSTLVQMYMAWMQLVRHKGWNSLICSHQQSTSKGIKRMYNLLIRHYPCEMLDEEHGQLRFSKLEGQNNVQQLESRDCLVLTGSSRSEDAARGYDISMAHLSEVAFWKHSTMYCPDDVVRSVCGSMALKAETVVVLESTADGVGDYFHDEWQRAEMGVSDKAPVFVPWHEIGIYTLPVDDAGALWQEMDDYERRLWSNEGCTLEQINWYHHKRREYREHSMMMAEYPSTPSEAFVATGSNPFAREHLDRLEEGCAMGPVLVGDIQADGNEGMEARRNVRLVRASNGLLRVWEYPQSGAVRARYMAVVDVGGRSATSDYSVIAVWRVEREPHHAAIVAQWRGHIDHDALAWKAMQLAIYYNQALLVVESNTLTNEAARAGESDYILRSVSRVYGNVYQRGKGKLGFHTNVKTKREAITALVKALRLGTYTERDRGAVNEMRDYEERRGQYAARPGKHDDILMTRAIGLLLMEQHQAGNGGQAPSPSMSHQLGTYNRP